MPATALHRSFFESHRVDELVEHVLGRLCVACAREMDVYPDRVANHECIDVRLLEDPFQDVRVPEQRYPLAIGLPDIGSFYRKGLEGLLAVILAVDLRIIAEPGRLEKDRHHQNDSFCICQIHLIRNTRIYDRINLSQLM